MKKTLLFGLLVIFIGTSALVGCKAKDDDTTLTTATITIMATGTLEAGTLIGGIDVTMALPSGVTVKASPDDTNQSIMVTDDGVVTASGVATGANTLSTYSAAGGTVAIHVAKADGFATGEFVKVQCDISVGSVPTATGFGLSGFNAVDLNGAAITGLTAGYTATIK